MLEHPHAPGANSEDKLPNQYFFSWLKDHTDLFVSQFFALLGFIYVPVSILYYAAHLGHDNPLQDSNPYILIIVDAAHIVVLILFVAVLLGILYKNQEGAYRTGRAYERLFNESPDKKRAKLQVKLGRLQLRRFKHYFLWFWIAMLALYISFTFKHSFELPLPEPRPATAVSAPESTGNDVSSDASMQESTGKPADHENASRILKPGEVFSFLRFPFLTFALNNLSMLFIFWCFLIMYLPSYDRKSNVKRRMGVGFSSFFVLMLTVSFPLLLVSVYHGGYTLAKLTGYATVFEGASGVFNAVVLALLIARLDSKLIGLPSQLIGLLYFYSAVQPLFAVFEQPGEPFKIIQTSVLIIVFGFKIYFFLIIVYALQTGRMLNFLICFPQLARRVDSIWDNQWEVRAKQENQWEVRAKQEDDSLFRLSIIRKKDKAYTSCDHFRTLEDCDEKEAELREVMKKESLYRPNHQAGTHWVDVFNSHGHKIFRSVSLKSEEAVKDLIEESMDNIPYCKYDRG